MAETPYHIPALLPECMDALDIKPGGVYVDVTYGGGGHSGAILERLSASEGGHLYAFDRDQDAVERCPHRDDPRFTMVWADFRFVANFMRYHDVDDVDGLLADLGVSFHHFDDSSRGFSFREDAPLDMRMNRRSARTAATLLEESTEQELTEIFKLYGELPRASAMARAIVKARAAEPVATTGRLLRVVTPLIDPRKEKKELAQLFQALRIVVNDEMGSLKALLAGALQVLRPGGRLAVITYHSLEDRMVKNFMRTGNVEGREEKDFFGRLQAPVKPLYNKPITPSADEVERNPRSRSAKLRVGVKL